MKAFLCICFCFFWLSVLSQEKTIRGEVLEAATNEPIVGATVFYDGSAIGTITDLDGKFSLTTKRTTNTPLIIRSLAFETLTLPDLETSFIRVFMKEAAIALNEVTLEPDTWSREKKLKVFRREFLGAGNHRCVIKNEEDLRLYYNKTKKTLFVYANRPLEIDNNKLGYHLTYDLVNFEVKLYADSSNADAVEQTFYSGTTQFFDKTEDQNRSFFERRKKAYFGSTLHFFRAFYSNRLKEEGFQFYRKGVVVPFVELFEMTTVDELLFVAPLMKKEHVGILYDGSVQSVLQTDTDEFIIDPYGNYSPTYGVLFGGVMGKKRIGAMLPIDFEISD